MIHSPLTERRPDRFGSVWLARPMLRALPSAPAIPILMYHSISDDREATIAPYYRLSTSPGRFREHMVWLRDAGFTVITVDDALHRLAQPTPGRDHCAVVTFDDGYRDFMDNAWPILSDFGVTSTVFLPTAFIGNSRRSFNDKECLTWAEARELARHGVSFGAHSVTHPILRRLSWQDVRKELGDSRAQIEDELQLPTRTFAYPYAFPQEDPEFVKRFRDELVDSGYTSGVTTAIGRARPHDDRLCLRRLPINQCDDQSLFVGKLIGAYDWVGAVQKVFRRAKRRVEILVSALHGIPTSCPFA